MEISVRGIVIDADERILLVKHASDQPWTLPGGHTEDNENPYQTLKRELREELSLDVVIIGSDTVFSQHHVAALPLPVSMHTVAYEHRMRGEIEKFEYVFFARTDDEVDVVDEEEIFDWKWMSQEDIFALEGGSQVFVMIQEILEQNGDLLEIL